MERPMPWAAAELATPTERSDQSTDRRGWRGHAIKPSRPYKSREEGVPHRDVRPQEVRDVGDEVAHDEGLAARIVLEEGDEALAEHEGLELEGGIEDPEATEDDLERPLGVDDRGEVSLGVGGTLARVAGVVPLAAAAAVPVVAVVAAVAGSLQGAPFLVVGRGQSCACAVHHVMPPATRLPAAFWAFLSPR
jgi:hypothetical protein